MIVRNFTEKDKYYDSVFLMGLAAKLSDMQGINNISVGMGTPLNKDTMSELGLLLEEGAKASQNDLIIALAAIDEEHAEAAYKAFLTMLIQQNGPKGEKKYRSLQTMSRTVKDRNLAVISLAGQYAAAEAEKALKMGMDVFMFSDNVPLEQQIALKKLAQGKGLLMMGPDCGLSFINGVAIGLCSKVRRGSIGIAAACGSGMQEVMNIIHRQGYGVSHAIGVGGRDLSEKVGGITMLQSIDLLEADEATKVIILISKPPATSTAQRIFAKVKQCTKPVVIQFINCKADLSASGADAISDCFENTAKYAIALSEGQQYIPQTQEAYYSKLEELAKTEAQKMASGQKYLRGLYCGGSLAQETITLAQNILGPIYGNIAFDSEHMLQDPYTSIKDCMIDIGSEEFTLCKPHVAIDPAPRVERFIKEAQQPEVAVILMDMLLGYSLCEDPAGMMVEAIRHGINQAKQSGRHLCVIASICGSDLDPQNMYVQEQKLKDAGVIVMKNNGEASRLAAQIIRIRREMSNND